MMTARDSVLNYLVLQIDLHQLTLFFGSDHAPGLQQRPEHRLAVNHGLIILLQHGKTRHHSVKQEYQNNDGGKRLTGIGINQVNSGVAQH